MRSLFGILLLFAFQFIQAQSSLSVDLERGFLFLHSQDVAPIGQSYPSAINFSYSKWLSDISQWQSCHCFPRVGLSTGFHYYDNPEVLGWGIPVQGFLEPWYKISDNWFLQIKAGLGLIYLSRPYDAAENPLNLSYSLPVSAYVSLGLGISKQLNPNWRVGFSAAYDHTSNGGIREPNKGLNYPMFGLNVDYSAEPIRFQSGSKKPFSWQHAGQRLSIMNSLAAQAGGRVGEGVNEQDVTYLVSGLALRYSRQVAPTSALFLEFEWMNNQAYQRQIERQNLNLSSNQWGLQIGHEFLLGKFVFAQAMGYYLFKEFGASSQWYQRYTLLYYPWKRLGFGPGLKAHAQVAEYLEFRIVYDILQ